MKRIVNFFPHSGLVEALSNRDFAQSIMGAIEDVTGSDEVTYDINCNVVELINPKIEVSQIMEELSEKDTPVWEWEGTPKNICTCPYARPSAIEIDGTCSWCGKHVT